MDLIFTSPHHALGRHRPGLEFFKLENGVYSRTEISPDFPMLAPADAARLLEDSRTLGRVPWMKAFRWHVRGELAATPPGPRQSADQP